MLPLAKDEQRTAEIINCENRNAALRKDEKNRIVNKNLDAYAKKS